MTTHGLPPQRQNARWSEIVAAQYFPLELEFGQTDRFDGAVRGWDLGQVQASRLASDAAMYRRRQAHLKDGGDEALLLTIPRAAPVRFLQMGREVACPPGGFILERGNEPYEFSYGARNDLIVAKIAHRHLAERLPDPGRFCAIRFDSTSGVGALLVDHLRSSGVSEGGFDADARHVVGRQIIDLLALAIQQDPRAAQSGDTPVRSAHLLRIMRVIAACLSDPDLTPSNVAARCDISTRYLHDICRGDGASFGARLREARLLAAQQLLIRGGTSITEIAYGCGFANPSAFSRAFRARFGCAPRDMRGSAPPV